MRERERDCRYWTWGLAKKEGGVGSNDEIDLSWFWHSVEIRKKGEVRKEKNILLLPFLFSVFFHFNRSLKFQYQ